MFNKKFTKKPTEKQKIGQVGENYACDYLKSKGYKIIERNYLKKWGEIDIIAIFNKKIHFVEVKSVSCEIFENIDNVICETDYRPEENVHPWKLQRLSRVIQTYLWKKDFNDDLEWQFDIVTVYIDSAKKLHKIDMMEDIIL